MPSAIELTQSLIRCPSITPNDAGCQLLIQQFLEPLGFKCESMRFGDVDNLWARFGTESPLIVMAGHTDVVPTGPEADWSSPPFEPVIRDGYLYGRGAVDMKGGVASMLAGAQAFLKTKPTFKGSLAFLITSDEEGPSVNGTKKVVDTLLQRGEKIDYCIIGEPSSDKQLGDQVRIGRRGSLHGRLIVNGKQGHVAHPHLAVNPIHLSMNAMHELANTEWDKGNQDFPPTSFQISNIHGGTGATNVIPGHLEIVFNFRYSTAVTVKELQERTEELLKKYKLNYHVEWSVGGEPFLTKRGKLIAATQEAIKQITGLEPRLSTGGGTSDGRFIAPTGAEVVELGPTHATAHQVNESVRVDDLETLTACYQAILMRLV